MWILQNRRAAFSEAFYLLHEKRTKQMLRWAALQIGVAGSLASLGLWQLFFGKGALLPGLFSATFLVMLLSAILGAIDQFRVRVLPYFEKEVGGTDTWRGGRSLLWCSRDLDQLAQYLEVPPLSSFLSGDDLVRGEELRFFKAAEALPSVERLLARSKASRFHRGLVADLTSLREALKNAAAKNVSFCLLLREGTSSTRREMSLRRGSFF